MATETVARWGTGSMAKIVTTLRAGADAPASKVRSCRDMPEDGDSVPFATIWVCIEDLCPVSVPMNADRGESDFMLVSRRTGNCPYLRPCRKGPSRRLGTERCESVSGTVKLHRGAIAFEAEMPTASGPAHTLSEAPGAGSERNGMAKGKTKLMIGGYALVNRATALRLPKSACSQ